MKKLIAYVVLLAMCVMGFAACSNNGGGDSEETSGVTAAKNYLVAMYKDSTVSTPTDYTVVGVVKIGGTEYPITWTTDHESVKVVPGTDKMVTIDVDEANPEEVTYNLTATLTDAEGKTETATFEHKVPAAIIIDSGMSYSEIIDLAYTLEAGLTMDGTHRLCGTITAINTAWSPDYQNITVTIKVNGSDKEIQCFRLKGDNAENLAVGDVITVEGSIKNYNGTIEFDAGCVLVGMGEHKDYTAILDAAYALEAGAAMTAPVTMTGVITTIDTPYDAGYKNITVTIVVNGDEARPIQCYRLQGEGVENLSVGDTITVTGTIKNYNGIIEFDAKCTADYIYSPGGDEPAIEMPTTPEGIVDAAYELESGKSLPEACTLTGVITSVDTAFDPSYNNVTVTIVVAGKTDKPIQAFRLKGEGADTIAVGDTITVTGTILNYGGKIEFNSGCTLDAVVKGGDAPVVTPEPTPEPTPDPTPVVEMTPEEILNALYALEDGQSLDGEYTLTGVIDSFKYTYSPDFATIQLTIIVNGMTDKPVVCYKLGGEGIDKVEIGDTITVTGPLKNYMGTYEFNGCTLVSYEKGTGVDTPVAGETLVLNANDLTAGTLTETTTFGAFTITATADASVTIDGNKKKTESGLEFTQRIKLGGTGKIESRSVSFATTGAATVTVYAMSSSGDTERNLLLMGADGTVLATNVVYGTVENSTIPAAVYEITEAGTYYLGSEKSGINIYYIEVK